MTACLIDPVRLATLLGPARVRFDVDALAECDSTNSVLLARAAGGAAAGSVVVADRQAAGRGRRGRAWQSAPGDALTFSLLWRFAGDPGRLAGLSLAVGVAVARALAACGLRGAALKWPNDLVLDGGKLGGILIELAAERGAMAAVIGIGINLLPPPPGPAYSLPPAALAQMGTVPERHQLLAALLESLAATLDLFAVAGFAALRDEWGQLNAWQGQQVRLFDSGAGGAPTLLAEGRCDGADADGALLITTADGRCQRFLVGDLSLRAA